MPCKHSCHPSSLLPRNNKDNCSSCKVNHGRSASALQPVYLGGQDTRQHWLMAAGPQLVCPRTCKGPLPTVSNTLLAILCNCQLHGPCVQHNHPCIHARTTPLRCAAPHYHCDTGTGVLSHDPIGPVTGCHPPVSKHNTWCQPCRGVSAWCRLDKTPDVSLGCGTLHIPEVCPTTLWHCAASHWPSEGFSRDCLLTVPLGSCQILLRVTAYLEVRPSMPCQHSDDIKPQRN